MGDFVFNLLLQDIHVHLLATERARHLLLEILADQIHQLFAITQVNKAAANDIWAGQQPASATLHGQHHHKNTLLAHVDTVF